MEQSRREWKRKQMTDALAEAALDLANGLNGAHERLVHIAREIEAFAKDRSDFGKHLDYHREGPAYPKPPAIAYPASGV